ncbi:hypothetical protein [Paenibacillus senegalimassiliensis]|nr:hypothetical protein [Paenibacillus senegalimassiliensis]
MELEKRICLGKLLLRSGANQVGWNRGNLQLSSLRLTAGVEAGAFYIAS